MSDTMTKRAMDACSAMFASADVMPGSEQDAASDGLSRRALVGAALALGILPARAEGVVDEVAGATAPGILPDAVKALNDRLFPGFRQQFIQTDGIQVEGHAAEGTTINTLVGGKGPPLMLIHGHPENHVCWHKMASKLAERFTVVLPDLRGYGDSGKPGSSPDHVNYSKRAMGADLVQVMRKLGFDRFQAVGHDRGGRVLQFMMMDHPEAVTRGVVLDIAPTDLMYAQTDKAFATKYFWWFFQIQEAPLPERFIGALPRYYVESHLDIQSKTPGAVAPFAMADYVRTYSEPAAIHGVCEDYRAAVGIDSRLLEAARAADRRIKQPLLALWGAKGTVGRQFDVVGLWKQEASDVTGHGLPCGHLIPEEDPDGPIEAMNPFLQV